MLIAVKGFRGISERFALSTPLISTTTTAALGGWSIPLDTAQQLLPEPEIIRTSGEATLGCGTTG